MQASQLLGGIDPELLGEDGPRTIEGGEGLPLPVRAVEREHELAPEPLAERMRSVSVSSSATTWA